MTQTLAFTGERFVPAHASGDIAVEHTHRYAFARRFVAGRRALDAACGEGYGTALLGAVAEAVIGVDFDEATIAHARSTYASAGNVSFETGSVTALPFADASFTAIVSFETIEHLAADDQPRMLAEFARVLAPDGVLVLSSPNRRRYSDECGYRNPYHRHELYRADLERLLDGHFAHRRWFHQQPAHASAVWSENASGDADRCEAWTGGPDRVEPMGAIDGIYHLVVAAKSTAALANADVRLSLYTDLADTMGTAAQANAAEVLRLDALLKERDAALDRQAVHVAHLERLVAERERIVRERDNELAAVNAARVAVEATLADTRAALEQEIAAAVNAVADARHALAEASALVARRESELDQAQQLAKLAQDEVRGLEAALLAQERLIAYQHTLRWWLKLPWLRAKHAWQRRQGA